MTETEYHWPSVASYSKYILHFTGLRLNTMGEFQILLGIILGWQMIIRYGPERLKFLLNILGEKHNDSVSSDPQKLTQFGSYNKTKDRGEWAQDLKSIHLPFCSELIRKIDKILRRFDDVVAYAQSVTVGQFSFNWKDGKLWEKVFASIKKEMGFHEKITQVNFTLVDESSKSQKLLTAGSKQGSIMAGSEMVDDS